MHLILEYFYTSNRPVHAEKLPGARSCVALHTMCVHKINAKFWHLTKYNGLGMNVQQVQGMRSYCCRPLAYVDTAQPTWSTNEQVGD